MDFLTAYALLIVGAICLFIKIGFLIWAYVRTRKLAAIAYGLYVFASAAVPILLLPQSPDYYPLYQLITALLETTFFVWLVRSLIKRPSRPLPNDV